MESGGQRSTVEGEPWLAFQDVEPDCFGQWRALSEGAGKQHILGQVASEIGVHRQDPPWREGPKPSLWRREL